tara:strand:+ start:232 stop:414 length:183 start_codon:yes stop_codon:yes gene_type:complete
VVKEEEEQAVHIRVLRQERTALLILEVAVVVAQGRALWGSVELAALESLFLNTQYLQVLH